MRIAVLAGGLGPERDVSISSGSLIANALMESGHSVLLLDLYLGAKDAADFDRAVERYGKASYKYTVPEIEPDLDALRAENGDTLIGDNILNICRTADITFLALHGSIGEDGRLQAVFDTYNIRYTGTGNTGSLLAMDKEISKELMRFHGVSTPEWLSVNLEDGRWDASANTLGFPCVVKPCGCGSSVGVSIVDDAAGLESAVLYAAKYESRMLIEKKIEGREFSVGVIDGKALPPIEIIPKTGFYDYKNKYQADAAEEVCPAQISAETEAELKSAALRVHKALRLGDYSRIDFMMDANGGLFCLEANTLPGMTPTSLLPQEAAAAGISYRELCGMLVEMALRRKG